MEFHGVQETGCLEFLRILSSGGAKEATRANAIVLSTVRARRH